MPKAKRFLVPVGVVSTFVVLLLVAVAGAAVPNRAERSALVAQTPTVDPTATALRPPGTNTPTPVDRDYGPVIMGLNITPTVTVTISPYTPTLGPTATAVPPPG